MNLTYERSHNYVGVIIAISRALFLFFDNKGGNLCISVALNIQKYVHNQLQARTERLPTIEEGLDAEIEPLLLESDILEIREPVYYKQSVWWLGQFMITLGEIGNFVAYGFSSAILVAPLGSFEYFLSYYRNRCVN